MHKEGLYTGGATWCPHREGERCKISNTFKCFVAGATITQVEAIIEACKEKSAGTALTRQPVRTNTFKKM